MLRNRKTFTRITWEGMPILIYKDRVFYNQKLEISQVVAINIRVSVYLTMYYRTSGATSMPIIYENTRGFW